MCIFLLFCQYMSFDLQRMSVCKFLKHNFWLKKKLIKYILSKIDFFEIIINIFLIQIMLLSNS